VLKARAADMVGRGEMDCGMGELRSDLGVLGGVEVEFLPLGITSRLNPM
jgi:hypothetical protein